MGAKKKKKNVKGTNLNHEPVAANAEVKKKVVKGKDEDEWEDEAEMAAPIMKVQVAGSLVKEEDQKEEQSAGAAWRKMKQPEKRDINDRKFPTLAKAVKSSNINIDDGSNANINIKTNANVFAALEDDEVDSDDVPVRPKEIKPNMIKKQKGEMQSMAIQREVKKYSSKEEQKQAEEDEEEEEEREAARQSRKKEKVKKVQEVVQEDEEPEEVAEDVKIEADEKASRAKYVGRAKLPTLLLSKKELAEAKPLRAQPKPAGKKKRYVEEEQEKPKLLVADWD